MPYFVEAENPACAVGEFATVKDDGEVMGCHGTKDEAIDQGVAIALNEDSTFEGERSLRQVAEEQTAASYSLVDCAEPGELSVSDFVDLTPPAFVCAVARRAKDYSFEVMAIANGNMTPAMWVELRDNLLADSGLVWGVRVAPTIAKRMLAYADGVVGRIEAEAEDRSTVTGLAKSKLETRIVEVEKFEIREGADGMHLEGYAALFNSRSENLGGFTETIQPGAFRASLKARNDIKLLWNHDTGAVLGSTRAGTLTLTEDARGLRVMATLPNTSYGRDAAELVRRGDVTGFSFGFSMPTRGGDEWSADGTERLLKSVRLFEVSLVAFPAYSGTAGTATVRGLDKIAKRADVDADALADALLKIENGEDISTDDRQLLEKVIGELAFEAETPVDDHGLDMLALKKKKLQLLMGY